MVVYLVELIKQKRIRGETVRPSIYLPVEIWNRFIAKYRNSDERNKVIAELFISHIEEN